MRRNQSYSPRPSVAEPRRELLLAVRSFVRAARTCPGVLRIALVGSLVTSKAIPKDADVLVMINGTMDLGELARAGGRLMAGISAFISRRSAAMASMPRTMNPSQGPTLRTCRELALFSQI